MAKANAVVQWECRTRIYAGHDAWKLVASEQQPSWSRSVLVLGSGFAAANFRLVEEVRRRLDVPMGKTQLVQAPATVEQVESLVTLLAGSDAETVVAIGGTATLDVTKIACHEFADDRTLTTIRARGTRQGVITLPFGSPGRVRQVLVPTTIGPAAEIRPYAAVQLRGQQRLIYGAGLQPLLAVIDSEFTDSLPQHALLGGILASLIRFVDPHIDGSSHGLLTVAAIRNAVSVLVSLGNRAQDNGLAASDRLRASYLNAAQTGLTFAERHPYVSTTCAIAAEMTGALKLRPVTAMAAVLPHLWRRIENGDSRFGDGGRLRQAWGWIRAAGYPDLPDDPAEGIAELIRFWGIDIGVPRGDQAVNLAASRTARFWGGKASPLAGVSVADLRDLISDTVSRDDDSAGSAT